MKLILSYSILAICAVGAEGFAPRTFSSRFSKRHSSFLFPTVLSSSRNLHVPQPNGAIDATETIFTQSSRVDKKRRNVANTDRMTMSAISAAALAASSAVAWKCGAPFALALIPHVACLIWGLPSALTIGNWKSIVSTGHRLGGIATLVLPLVLAAWHTALKGGFPPMGLYASALVVSALNLSMGAQLITRRVPGYDIPTLRAFAVGVSLGFAFLGHSLLFVAGPYVWYRPVAYIFGACSVYAAIFAWSDALQHAANFFVTGRRGNTQLFAMDSKGRARRPLFWKLPFERARLGDVFFRNLWRQPTQAALEASVSPANAVVAFTTGMTALFATLPLLQLRYLSLGPEGMAAFVRTQPVFCAWSSLQALLAVVANNFGTFAGTLVIQRRTSQQIAGVFNALGLLVPVLNIAAYLLLDPSSMTLSQFVSLLWLPSQATK